MNDRPRYSKWNRKSGGFKDCPKCGRRYKSAMRIDGKVYRVKLCVECGVDLPDRLTYPKRGAVAWYVREFDPRSGQTHDERCRSSEHADEVIRQRQRDYTADPIQGRLLEHASHIVRQIESTDFDDAVNQLIEHLGGSSAERMLRPIAWSEAVRTICGELRDKGMSAGYVANIERVAGFFREITGVESWSSVSLDHVATYRNVRLTGGWLRNGRTMRAVSAHAVNGDLRTLGAFLSRAVKKRWITDNVLAGAQDEFVKTRTIKVAYMPDADLRVILQKAGDGWLRSFLLLAYYTGARRSDLLSLDWEDVDLTGETVAPEGRQGPHIYIRGSKADTPRWTPLHPDAVAAVKTLRRHPVIDRKLFPIRESKSPGSYVSHLFAKLCVDAGLTAETEHDGETVSKNRWKLHDLRRKSNTDLRNGGASTKERSALLGHRTDAVNEAHYEAILPERERNLIDALPGFGLAV